MPQYQKCAYVVDKLRSQISSLANSEGEGKVLNGKLFLLDSSEPMLS